MVREKRCKARFGIFLDFVPNAERDQKLPFLLAKRWWDTTNTFHLPFGEMTLTPLNFYAITGLSVGGKQIQLDLQITSRPEYIENLLGFLPLSHTDSSVKILEICNFLDSVIIDEKFEEAIAQITRIFFPICYRTNNFQQHRRYNLLVVSPSNRRCR